MMDEGLRSILRLPKIRQAIIAHPEPLRWYSGRRIEVEMLQLIHMYRRFQCMDVETDDVETNSILLVIHKRKTEILQEVLQRMIMEGGQVNDEAFCKVVK
ncbi:hypothetical protein DPMN_146758 [Dreissena polymorpha]|uniref:Uncharacterized protein n=1 Tax=Dreissena polymorpha TaxID=45954 RepID=A0A9D4IYP7_DREPO|nr:hypothetical protein DPMN_146758 [Dreissena polymorpha]